MGVQRDIVPKDSQGDEDMIFENEADKIYKEVEKKS